MIQCIRLGAAAGLIGFTAVAVFLACWVALMAVVGLVSWAARRKRGIDVDEAVMQGGAMPRVMTLEEACGADYCVYELRDVDHLEPVSVVLSGLRIGDLKLIEVYRVGREGPELIREDEYNKGWRCWDRWPEDMQREATPWP